MTNNNDKSNNVLPFNIWVFGFLWVFLNTVGFVLLNYLFLYLLPTISIPSLSEVAPLWSFNFFIYTLISGVITGGLLGTLQWYLIQYYVEWPKSWIIATIIGAIIVDLWYGVGSALIGPQISGIGFLVLGLVGSSLLPIVQWAVLQKLVDYAYLWIVVGVLSGFVASFVVDVLYFSGLMSVAVLYGYDWQVSQIVSQIVNETIMVSCLIGLLYITLKS